MDRQRGRIFRGVLALAAICGLFGATPAPAQVAAGYSEYYIPGGEDEMSLALRSLGPTPASLNTHTLISITAWADDITLYYDHWEDGIDFDPANPASADETFTLATVGSTLALDNTPVGGIVIPRDPANTYYDGGDRIYVAGGAVTVTRSSWRDAQGRAVQAVAWEIYPVKPQLTTYVLPFGENLSGAFPDFLRTYLLVQATADGTTFSVDLDGDGTADPLDQNFDGDTADAGDTTVVSLNAGESFILGNTGANPNPMPRGALATVNSGAVVQGSSTLQVKFVIGDPAANYETRGISAFPRGYWTKDYYAPVGEPANGTFTDIFLYNPHASAITVTWETQTGSGSFVIGAGATVSYRAAVGALPVGSGVYLRGTDVFWGVSTVDSTGQVNEWAYSLLPSTLLYTEHFLGWAEGGADGNDSGAFVTAVQDNTALFVDVDNDGAADQTYTLDRLDALYVTDPSDGDLSGAHFWATGPFTMSFGQNPDTAPAQATSGDLGYVAIPATDFISLVLSVDKSADPAIVPAAGGTTSFTLVARSQKYTIDAVSVIDTLPAGWSFVADSAVITLPDLTTVSGAAANPTITGGGLVLTWPGTLLGDMAENQRIEITFSANAPALAAGTLSRNGVQARGTRTVGGVTQTFNTYDFAYVASGDLLITKSSNAPDPAYPGDAFSYTVTVTNPAGAPVQTGVSLYDPLPAGITAVPATGSVTCDRERNVRDAFGAVSYANDDGSVPWSAAWTETDAFGATDSSGPGSGYAAVAGGTFRFAYATSNVRDEFTTNDSYAENYGSENWTGSWIETGDDGSASSGDILIDNGGNRLSIDNAQVGDTIRRTADVTGATSATISFTLTDGGIDAGERLLAEYSVDGGAYVLMGTFDGGTGWTGTNPLTVALAGNATLTLRLRVDGNNFDGGEQVYVDTVNIAFDAPPSAAGTQIVRAADLSGATSASLSFSFTPANLEAGDTVIVEASADGAAFTTLETFDGAAGAGTRSYDLRSPTDYVSATTTIRLRVTSGINQTNESFAVDDVDIAFVVPSTFASGEPPSLLDAAAGCMIPPGASLTLTFDVTVDSPLAPGITEATNTAAVTTDLYPVQITASVTDALANPSLLSASVGGRVWLDGDGDGVLDVGEPGIANVEVTLRDRFGTPIAIAITDAGGRYLFTGVLPGTGYYVEVTDGLPAGLAQSAPAGHADNRTDPFDLAAGDAATAQPLGYRPAGGTATFGDLAWVDPDADGLRDPGEIGLGGVAITLYLDADADDHLDTGIDTEIATTTSAPDGSYLFTGVTPSGSLTYFVSAVTPAGYLPSTGASVVRFQSVAAGTAYLTADFGFVGDTVTTYTIRDRVWLDADGNGTFDGGEGGIAGVTVELLDASLNVIGTTTSAADGTFAFLGVAGGGADYTVRINDTAGVLTDFFGTTPYALALRRDEPNLTGDVDRTGAPSFGFTAARSIGDTVYNDVDGNGARDAGEPGIAGVNVALYLDGGSTAGVIDGGDTYLGGVTTDAWGTYLFSGLADGTYLVSVPDGGVLTGYTFRGPGADGDPGSPGVQKGATLAGGASVLSVDFGYQADVVRSLTGTIWEDDDGDGVIDALESARLAAVTLEVLDGAVVVATATTDASGIFAVAGLADRTYTVRVTDDNGVLLAYVATVPATGERSVDLSAGDATGVDFGFRSAVPTRIFLVRLGARAVPGGALVEWETAAEIGTAGYHLVRVEPGGDVSVNGALVPAFLGRPTGGRYALFDAGAAGPTLSYRLVEVRRRGAPLSYGPFTVRLARGAATDQPEPAPGAAYAREPRPVAGARAAAPAALTADPAAAGPGTRVRIAVDRSGLFRVAAADVAPLLGMSVRAARARIASRSLALSTGGRRVAYLPQRDGRALSFYGQGIDTVYTGENVYWLARGTGLAMRRIAAAPSGGPAPGGTFLDTARAEEQIWADTTVPSDPEGDYWFWDALVAGDPTLGIKPYPVTLPARAGTGAATLRILLRGASETSHRVIARVGGATVGEAAWSGLGTATLTGSFDQGALGGETLAVELEAAVGTEGYGLVLLDAIEVDYQRRYVAAGDSLLLRADGNPTVTVSGFTSPQIRLLDLTRPNRPRRLGGVVVAGGPGDYSATFRPAAPDTPYLAVSAAAVLSPARLAPWRPARLAASSNAAEHLVIAPAALLPAAESLAAYRRAQGLTSRVVSVEAIMDELNGGLFDPHAVTRFLARARAAWATPPRYVVLAGDGSYDYRNRYGFADSLVPPLMVSTPDGLIGSDSRLADTDGDGVPDLAVGRLPATTNADLQALVDKIVAFEAEGGAWRSSALFAADDPDPGAGDFTADSLALLALLPAEVTATTDHLAEQPGIAAARGLLLGTVNAGVAHVSYLGHAGFDRLADEGLFVQATDVDALANGARLPLFTIFSCLAGSFTDPGVSNLGEGLLLHGGGGASAVLAPSGLALHARSVRLARAFLEARHGGGVSRLGDAVLAGMRGYAAAYGADVTLDLYGLLGDPALVLP